MGVSLNKSPSSRGGRRRSLGGGFSDINVTPLVDVMLVLLIVFMVTAPLLTVGVPVDLPKTKAAKMNDQIEPLVVTVDASGKSYLQEMELEGEALIARLMAVTGNNPDAKIYVRGDQKIAYGRIMEVMGNVAAAGFTKVSLLAEMPTSPASKQSKTQATPPAMAKAPAIQQSSVPQALPSVVAPKSPAPLAPQRSH